MILTKPARCGAVSSELIAIVVALLPGSQSAKVRPEAEAISVKFRFGEMKVKRIFGVPLVTPSGGYRGVEQLVARRAHNPKVVSSSLAPATKKTKERAIRNGCSFLVLMPSETVPLHCLSCVALACDFVVAPRKT